MGIPPEQNEGMTTRVFLLDDHEIVRRGLRELLESEDDLTVVGEAGNATDAYERIAETHPDVAMLDVRLPDGNGVEVCREIRSQHPEVQCLMFTSFADDEAPAPVKTAPVPAKKPAPAEVEDPFAEK